MARGAHVVRHVPAHAAGPRSWHACTHAGSVAAGAVRVGAWAFSKHFDAATIGKGAHGTTGTALCMAAAAGAVVPAAAEARSSTAAHSAGRGGGMVVVVWVAAQGAAREWQASGKFRSTQRKAKIGDICFHTL